MRCTRSALVLPGLPGGLPATMTILSPIAHRPSFTRAESTSWTISSVWCTVGAMNVSTPQVRASWLRVAGSVENAISGIGDRYLASRRAVSPVSVNATRALAPTMGRARRPPRAPPAGTPPGHVGDLGPGRPGRVDHRLEHLSGHDDRAGPLPGELDRQGLHGGHLLERELDAEVAAGHHDAVEGVHDVGQELDRL